MTACFLCQQNEGAFAIAGETGEPLGLACSRCHRIITLIGEDPAAVNVDRAAQLLSTIADNRQRADMRLAIRRWKAGDH